MRQYKMPKHGGKSLAFPDGGKATSMGVSQVVLFLAKLGGTSPPSAGEPTLHKD